MILQIRPSTPYTALYTQKRDSTNVIRGHLKHSETNQILGWSDTTILLHLVNSARLPSLVLGSVDDGFGNAGRGLNPRDLHQIPSSFGIVWLTLASHKWEK